MAVANTDDDLGFVPEASAAASMPQASHDDDLGFVADAPSHVPVTQVESALRGAVSGGTLGFGDELQGAYGGVKDTATGNEPWTFDSLVKNYQKARDAARATDALAQKDNPGSYALGQIGGTLATSLIPGAGAAGLASKAAEGLVGGTRLAGPIVEGLLSGGLVGAAQGLGTSNADLTKGDVGQAVEDVEHGAELGGALGGAIPVAAKAVKGVASIITPSSLAKVFLGTPEELTQGYIANPGRINNAGTIPESAQNIAQGQATLKDYVINGSQASRDILTNEGKSIPGHQMAGYLNNIADGIEQRAEGVLTNNREIAAVKWLRGKAGAFNGVDAVSTNRAKDFLQEIGSTISNSSNPLAIRPVDDRALMSARTAIDQALKTESPAYASQMQQVASDAKLLNNLDKIGTSPDQLVNFLKRSGRDNTQEGTNVLKELGDRLGVDYLDQANASLQKEAFDKSITNGSRNVNLYNDLGKSFSHLLEESKIPGASVAAKITGPIIGATVDKFGRKITMSAVDAAVKLNALANSPNAQAFSQMAAPLVNLAKQGDPTSVLTFQLLSGIRRRKQEAQSQ